MSWIGVCSALRHGLNCGFTISSAGSGSFNIQNSSPDRQLLGTVTRRHDPKCLVIAVTFYKRAASLRKQAFADIGQPKWSCTSPLTA
jgi:hypothetical protein